MKQKAQKQRRSKEITKYIGHKEQINFTEKKNKDPSLPCPCPTRTQFSWLSAYSSSLACSSSPCPPSLPNFSTSCWVRLNWSDVTTGWIVRRYFCKVSCKPGTGSLGRGAWGVTRRTERRSHL